MFRPKIWWTLGGLLLLGLAQNGSTAEDAPSFRKEIAPILLQNCLACHGPKKAEAGYRIDTFERLTAAGDSTQPGFAAKDLDGSEAFRRITSTDPHERMPLEGDPLPAEQVALLKRWIEAGLPFDGPDPKAPLASYIPPPTHPPAPETYRSTLPITALTFSPDGSQLWVGGYHEITVWDPAMGQLVRRIANVPQRTFAIRFAPDGQSVAVAGGSPGKYGEVRLIRPESGEVIAVLGTTSDVVYDCAFSPQGDRLATAAADGLVRVFGLSEGKELLTIASHSDWVFAVTYDSEGKRLATASRDKTAKVFDAASGELLVTYSGHNQTVRGVQFHPEGKEVYSIGSDNRLHRWSVAEGKKTQDTALGSEPQRLSRVGDFLVIATADNKVRLFTAADQKPVRELAGAKDWLLSADGHAAGGVVAGGTFDGQVLVWNLADGKLLRAFFAAPGYQPPTR